ncbi:MAG: hypothetical protein ACLTDF_00115 [Coprococcus sp.]
MRLIDLYDVGIYKRLKFDNDELPDIPEIEYPIKPDIAEEDFQQAMN